MTTTTVQGVPIGTIVAYAGDTSGNNAGSLNTQGWLVCNGEEYDIDDYPHLNAIIGTYYGTASKAGQFKTPDLRGLFLRGVDNGAGKDPDKDSRTASAQNGNTGDKVGSYQEDAFKSHAHQLPYTDFNQAKGDNGDRRGTFDESQSHQNSLTTGGSETRPKNIYVNYIIKAKNV